jgi:undecaprenyl-diphosphatase
VKPAALMLAVALLGPLQSADDAIQAQVQRARRPALEGAMRAATDVGRPVWVVSGLLALVLFDPVAGASTAGSTLLVLAPLNLAVEGLKRAVGRTRPDGDRRRANSSFPSSHAANAVALAWMLSRRWPRGALAFASLAALVSISRVYLNRHFASDVLAGAALGALIPWIVIRLWPGLDPAIRRRSGGRAIASAPRPHGPG